MTHILIGFAESLPAPEVVFSLLDAGHTVSAFARRADLPLAHLPLQDLIVIPTPEDNIEAAKAAICDLMDGDNAPDIILPLDDSGLWLVNAALGSDPRSAGATGTQAEVALDKSAQITAALAAGLSVPRTVVVRQRDDLDQQLDFPAIAKPALAIRERNGRLGKGDATYLPDLAAVQNLKVTLTGDMEPLLVQPLVQGVGEGVFGYADETGVTGWSGHRRLRMMNPHGSGSSACIAAAPDAGLRAQIAVFITAIGWRGPFMVELLRDSDGTPWFMELNGRMWGSLALARRQGLEYPAWAVARLLDDNFSPDPLPLPETPIVQRNLGREILHLLFLLRGPKSTFHRAGWPRFWNSLGGVLKPTHPRGFYNYDSSHRLFFLRDAFWTVKRMLRK